MAGLVRGHKGLIYPISFTVASDTATVSIGNPYQIEYTITPSNATNQKINWSSSDTTVATVDNKGVITAVSVGTCIITGVYSYDGTTRTISVTTSQVAVSGVSLDKDTMRIPTRGNGRLHATVSPANASNKNIIWTSSDDSIATVEGGLVKFKKAGNCTITATTEDGGYTDACAVTCIIPVQSVSLNKTSGTIAVGETIQLVPTINPSNATIKTVTYSSSNTSVAKVSSTGLISYVADGTAIITCTTTQGGKTATCTVTCQAFQPIDRCFGYTGSVQSITLKPHKYCLEVRGAEGGCSTYHGKCGGRGGYASGCFTPTSECTLYIYVGGKGGIGIKGFYGGRNGGGGVQNIICYTSESNNMGSGGGATDIATLNCPMTTDSYYRYVRDTNSYNSRIIVAGGGGGAEDGAGGAGGGTTGCGGQGGTQSSAGGCCEVAYSGTHYSYYYCYVAGGKGYGASVGGGHHNHATAAPGGGGYYGGGIQGCVEKRGVSHGSGGSGYIGGVTNGVTCDGEHSFPTAAGGTETGHYGNGCVRIRSL